jgi:hypothetical protein
LLWRGTVAVAITVAVALAVAIAVPVVAVAVAVAVGVAAAVVVAVTVAVVVAVVSRRVASLSPKLRIAPKVRILILLPGPARIARPGRAQPGLARSGLRKHKGSSYEYYINIYIYIYRDEYVMFVFLHSYIQFREVRKFPAVCRGVNKYKIQRYDLSWSPGRSSGSANGTAARRTDHISLVWT